MIHKNTIGSQLHQLMAERSLNATQLAKLADVKPSFIYDVISGKSSNPSVVKLAQIASALAVDLSHIIPSHTDERRSLIIDTPYYAGSSAHPSRGDDSYVTISSVLIEASMGGGTIPTKEDSGKPYYFRREWIRNRLGARPDDLRMIFVRGDSMEPSLCDGDMILVDTTQKSPSPSGIFVLFDGIGLVAKRLEFISANGTPSIRIISDNPQYSTYTRSLDELHIIGRIVWFAREL